MKIRGTKCGGPIESNPGRTTNRAALQTNGEIGREVRRAIASRKPTVAIHRGAGSIPALSAISPSIYIGILTPYPAAASTGRRGLPITFGLSPNCWQRRVDFMKLA